MIIVITHFERNERTGDLEIIVSHGINTEDDSYVNLPSLKPEQVGAKYDPEVGEFVLV